MTVLYLVALLLALVELLRSKGQSLCTWAVVFVCLGLVWGHLPPL